VCHKVRLFRASGLTLVPSTSRNSALKGHAPSLPVGCNARFAFALYLAVTLLAPIVAEGADRKETNAPWIASAEIIRNGEQSGSGVYLKMGLIITAAHLTAVDANMSARMAGVVLPATLLKQGSVEEVDLSLLSIDEANLPASLKLPSMQLCQAPPWPGDPVIIVDSGHATASHIVPPQVLPFTLRNKFSTLIGDVATTGNSGSGVFDPNRKCLLGIISRKFKLGDKDVAKYFVPAVAIRDFLPAEFRS
jgi:Trypsin-like peptidase domain